MNVASLRKLIDKFSPNIQWTALIVIISLFSGVLLYWDYLFQGRLYVFTDTARDIYVNMIPNYIHLSEYVRNSGFPTWSFNIGAGTSILAGSLIRVSVVDPFTLLLLLTGPLYIVKLLPVMVVAKIVLSGVFFQAYLRYMGFTNFPSAIGALAYAFSGQMILRSKWFHYGTEVVCLPLLLISTEILLRKKNPIPLIISFAWLGVYNPLLIYYYLLFIIIYVVFRSIYCGFNTKEIILSQVKTLLWSAVGASISAFISVPVLAEFFSSNRLGDSKVTDAISASPIWLEYQTNFLRLFSNDVVGYGNNYHGWDNYLNAPALYVGILSLILIPQLFFSGNKKHKSAFVFAYIFCLLYLAVPALRNLINGTAGYHYKLTSFIVSFFLVLGAVQAIEVIILKGLKIKAFLLTILAILLSISAILSPVIQGAQVEYSIILIVTAVLSTYLFLGLYYHFHPVKKAVFGAILLITFAAELVVISHPTVNIADTISRGADITKVGGYNDSSYQLIKEIKQRDSSMYRIVKNYYSVFCCGDSLVQDYMGVNSYQSVNQGSYLDFFEGMNLMSKGSSSRTLTGVRESYNLANLLTVKYYIVRGGINFPGLELLGTFNDISIYRSNLAMPMGFVYTSFMSEKSFTELVQAEKETVIYQSAVLSDGDNPACGASEITESSSGVLSPEELAGHVRGTYENRALSVNSFDQKSIKGALGSDSDGILFFSVPYSPGWRLKINGKEAPIFKITYGFIGACVKSGKSEIDLAYRPPYLGAGVTISLFGLAAATYFLRRRSKI